MSGMPDRSASEIRRPIASASAIAAPPALPRLMNTSNGWPRSSSVMWTNIVPSGVSLRIDVPRSLSGRERFSRRWRFSASASYSAFLSRSISASSSAIVPVQLAELALVALALPSRSAFALLGRAGGEHLVVARAVAVDRDALALEVVRELVDRAHVVDRGGVREVRRLGDRRVAVLLEGRLHAHVPLGRDLVRGHEHALPLLRHFGEVDCGPRFAILSMSSSEYQPSRLRDRDEVLVHVGHHHAGLVAHERNGEQRLEARRAAGDDRDRAGRRDRGDVAVAEQLHRADALPFASRAHVSSGPQIERAHSGNAPRSLASRSLSFFDSTSTNSMTLAAELHALVRVVRDAEPNERVGEAHDAEADAADALRERVDLGQRVLVDVDDVVEEVRRERDVARERVPVHLPIRARSSRR